jgi:hypothetical protein
MRTLKLLVLVLVLSVFCECARIEDGLFGSLGMPCVCQGVIMPQDRDTVATKIKEILDANKTRDRYEDEDWDDFVVKTTQSVTSIYGTTVHGVFAKDGAYQVCDCSEEMKKNEAAAALAVKPSPGLPAETSTTVIPASPAVAPLPSQDTGPTSQRNVDEMMRSIVVNLDYNDPESVHPRKLPAYVSPCDGDYYGAMRFVKGPWKDSPLYHPECGDDTRKN